jgi:hypothetical protein
MKRITKESLATVFQISVIIFLFSYSAPSLQKDNNVNTVDTIRVVGGDPLYTNEQAKSRPAGNNLFLDYYQAKKISGLLNTQLKIVFNLKATSNTIVPGERNTKNENRLSSSVHPVFLSIK